MSISRYNDFVYENLNYARSVLRKTNNTDTNEDFLKIKSFCKSSGYLGLLTKLFFIDNIDIDEVESIYNSLVNLKVSVSDVINLNYNQLSDYLYDLQTRNSKSNDFKFQFTDGYYDYFRVFSYEGILDIGSPAWCIKTKSMWTRYTDDDLVNNQQWVIIKKISKKLLTPNTNYLSKYQNLQNPYIRYGVTIRQDGKIYMFDDNDGQSNQSEGNPKAILSNIKKFNLGQIIDTDLNLSIGIDPIIKFDKVNVYFISQKEVSIINDRFNFKFKKESNEDLYLIIKDGKFEKIITMTGIYVKECDGFNNKINPNFDKKIYYEICRWTKDEKNDNKVIKSSSLIPLYLKMGLTTIEKLLEGNKDFIKFELNGEIYLSHFYLSRLNKLIIQFINTSAKLSTKNLSLLLIRYNKSKLNYLDIEKFIIRDFEEYNPTEENIRFIINNIGEANIQNAFELGQTLKPKPKPGILTQFKKWINS